jgi:EmrB/QacA subfamily drug resistance transporter
MTQGRPRMTFAVLAIGVCSYSLLQSMTVPALPRIQQELDTDQSTAAWVLTAFLLAASVATPIGGRLGDSLGKRRMLVVSLSALAVGAVVAALATSIEVMIAARVVQGLGGGALPLAFGIIRDELPPRQIPGAIAFTSSLLAVGFGAGIVLAGPIIDTLGYHWLFLLPALVSGAGAVAAMLVVPESAVRSGEPIAATPAFLLTGWLVALLVGVSKAPQWGWTSPAVVGCLVAAAAFFGLWVYAERTAAFPLIDLHLMSTRGVWSANLVALLIGIAMYGSFGFLPQFNQTPSVNGYGFGATVAEAGHMMLPAAAGTFLCGLVAARLATRIGVRQAIVLGCLITSGGLGAAVFAHDQKWEMYLAGGLSGLGTGLTFACLANAVIAAVPPEKTGVATGMNANIRTVGGSIGAAVMTTIVTANVQPSGFPAEGGYTVGFAFLASATLLGGLAGLLIPRAPRGAGMGGAAQFVTVAGTPTWELVASRPERAERGATR